MKNTQVIFRSRPEGFPSEENFEIVRSDVPQTADGQVLRRTIYLSVDPFMRGRIVVAGNAPAPSDAQPAAPQEPQPAEQN